MRLELHLPCQVQTFYAGWVRITPQNTQKYAKIIRAGPLLSPACSNYPRHSSCSSPLWSRRESKWTWKSTSTWPLLTLPPIPIGGENLLVLNSQRISASDSDGVFLTPYSSLSAFLTIFNFPKRRWKLLLSQFCTVQSYPQGCSLEVCLRILFSLLYWE